MANYLTTDVELTNIANAIRNKMDRSTSAYAIISVTYPSGSICTCTKSSTVLTTENNNGKYLFLIPEAGEWTISCTDGIESKSKIIEVSEGMIAEMQLRYLPDPGDMLNNYSWEDISKISQAGVGDEYFDIGDCKAVALNGTVGTLALDQTLYVFILDFNHPIDKTISDNNIIFGGFKTALTGGVDVCLCDNKYSSSFYSGTKYFNLNHYGSSGGNRNTNYGGWKGCDFRYDILGATSSPPSYYGNTYKQTTNVGYDAVDATITTPVANTLMAALPNDFRSVLRLWNRYIDYKGNSSNADANCSTATVDGGISLLAEYEIFGSRSYANQYEQNHQKQMGYYSGGNSKIKYRHNYQSTAVHWWESSALCGNAYYFCYVHTSGSADGSYSRYSYGLAPAFKV